jgi:cell wall-associated NlpC family hydrolase
MAFLLALKPRISVISFQLNITIWSFVENSYNKESERLQLKCIFVAMNKAFRTLLLLLILSLASCRSWQKSSNRSRAKEPKVEHELLKGQSKRGSANRQERKEEDDQHSSAHSKNKEKELMTFIKDWYGTPHKMGGTTKKGVDCSGFIIVAYREVFNTSFKGRRAEDILGELQIVKWDNLQYGDLVFFKVKGRRIDHVGIYVGDGDFAHTSSSRGVMISALNNPYWSKRYFKAGRPSSS